MAGSFIFQSNGVFSSFILSIFFFSQGSTVAVEVWDDDGSQIVGKLHDCGQVHFNDNS